jgi:serine/threonine-protein kinase RsbW
MHKSPTGEPAAEASNGPASPDAWIPKTKARQLCLDLPADPVELGSLTETVEAFAADVGWTDDIAMQVNLVLEELLINAINYGYPDGRTGRIAVLIDAYPDEVRLRIEDDGDPFDPFAHVPPNLSLDIEDRPIGGLGIHLVRSYMDTCTYRYVDGRNQVTLVKRI